MQRDSSRPADLVRKRPANLAQTLTFPRPIGEVVLRDSNRKRLLRRLERLTARGYIGGASAVAQYHARAGGGYGVKVAILRPLPEPVPGWAKGAVVVGLVLMACSAVGLVVLAALRDLFAAAAALPWAAIIGGGFVLLLLLGLLGRGTVTVIQKVTIR